MSSEAIIEHRRGVGGGLAFVVCGPSGAGKNSVIERVMEVIPGFSYSVSFTTRPRRSDEVDGRDYHFITDKQFTELVENDEVVEHVTYLGHKYGTSRAQIKEVFAEGKDVILNIDVNGAKKLMDRGLNDFSIVYVFLTPSSLEILGTRLRERGTETEKQMQARLAVAAKEMKSMPLFEYLVINDDLDTAVDELRAIVVAERCRIIAAND
ncbi:guanylate kinase [Candidatus Bipolaricaulota bacterium]|nr:guanylate kinase [Candidatus Bipolaricaulota bacterium]HHR84879.1 guanylate kinase [Candidatus Acetothermia bacterium]